MKARVIYINSNGVVSAKITVSHVEGQFRFTIADKSDELDIYMDDENKTNAALAAAAFNGDQIELRRLLDVEAEP